MCPVRCEVLSHNGAALGIICATIYQSGQAYIVKDLNLPTPRQKASLYRHSPAQEANSCSVTQEIFCISRNPWIILIASQQKLCSIELVKWQTRKLDILIPEEGTDMLSQNVGNKPTYFAQQTTRVKVTRKKNFYSNVPFILP